jgi:LPS-assembly lipoprotein
MWWRSRNIARAGTAALMALTLSACGFHLRGAGDWVPWPSALNPVRIVDAHGTGDLREELEQRLRSRSSVQIVDTGSAPVLRLLSEKFERRTLAVTLTGKASEFLLRLRVAMQVEDASGKVVLPTIVVVVQRNFPYDSTQVLAMEDEQQRLRQNMVRDAARELLARVAAQYPGTAH